MICLLRKTNILDTVELTGMFLGFYEPGSTHMYTSINTVATHTAFSIAKILSFKIHNKFCKRNKFYVKISKISYKMMLSMYDL